mgnify:FL=1
MTSAWESTEAAIHRWARESMGLAGELVYWPSENRPLPAEPYCVLTLTDQQLTGMPGSGSAYEWQTAATWLLTVVEGEGEHEVSIFTDDSETPAATASFESPDGTTPEDARDTMMLELDAVLPDEISATAVGDASLRLVGATPGAMFWLRLSETISAELEQAAVTRGNVARVAYLMQFDINSPETSGANAAHRLAARLVNGIGNYRALLGRCGWQIGTVVANRPGYQDDATASRSIVEIQLLGHEVGVKTPQPPARRPPALRGVTSTVTVISP